MKIRPYDVTEEKHPKLVFQNNVREDTAITKSFSLTIQQVEINGKRINTDKVIATCLKWPERVMLTGDILTDASKKITTRNFPAGTYQGIYFFEIKGRKLSKEINGSIPDN